MKRLTALILCISAVWSLAACGAGGPETEGLFYYRRSKPYYGTDDGIIAPEVRTVPQNEDGVPEILSAYFDGPKSRNLESPFPRSTNVISWGIDEDVLTLNLSESFAALSGVDLTVACSCIARTFLELLPVEQVSIQVMRETLNGKKAIVLGRSDMNLVDNSLDQLETPYSIYYAGQKRRYLIGVETSVNLADRDEVIRFLVQKLSNAPYNSDLSAPVPYGTKLLDVEVKNGVCTLNFSPEFETNAWNRPEAQRLTLLSISNTLTQVAGIDYVEFRVAGKPLKHYGALNLSVPLAGDERAVGPVRIGINEFDTTLYLANGSDTYLVGVPTRIRKTAGIPEEELILKALMRYAPLNGFYTTIPSTTVLNRITTDHGICYIDLSRDFLNHPESLELSVHAIVASVCKVKGINGVQIHVEGRSPAGYDPKLFGVLIPQFDWFV